MGKRKLIPQVADVLEQSITETSKSPVKKKQRKQVSPETPIEPKSGVQSVQNGHDIEQSASDQQANGVAASIPVDFASRFNYFDSLAAIIIDCIPAKFYFDDKDMQDELDAERRDRTANVKSITGKPLSGKAKHKRLKLDPDANETVSQIIRRKFGGDDEPNGDDDAWGRKEKLNAAKGAKKMKTAANDKMSRLHELLRQRIAELRRKRHADRQQKKKVERESKKQRRDKNRNKKQKSVTKGAKNAAESDEQAAASNSEVDGAKKAAKKKSGSVKKELDQTKSSKSDESASKKAPTVYNAAGEMIFSRFDLVAPPLVECGDNLKQKRGKKSKKNLEIALKKAQKQKSIIDRLESAGHSEKAEQFKSKSSWKAALARSEGEKVRDNPDLIKKSIKKIDKRKAKSARQWQQRNEQVESKKEAKQEKRERHLKERAKAKKQKQIERSKKRGRIGKL